MCIDENCASIDAKNQRNERSFSASNVRMEPGEKRRPRPVAACDSTTAVIVGASRVAMLLATSDSDGRVSRAVAMSCFREGNVMITDATLRRTSGLGPGEQIRCDFVH